MITLNGFTNGFQGAPSSVLGKTPQLCRWVYGERDFEGVSIFEDGHIWSGEAGLFQKGYRVGWLHEPRALHPLHYEWAEKLRGIFDCILTHDQALLDAYPDKFRYTVHAGVTVPREQWGLPPKSRAVAMLLSPKDTTANHRLRRQIAETVPSIDVYRDLYGDAKIDTLKAYRFMVVVENSSEPNWFTEHLLDAIALGCVPIYYYPEEAGRGQHTLEQYLDLSGLLLFGNLAELTDMLAYVNEMGSIAYEQFASGLRANQAVLPCLEVTEDWFVQHAIAEYVT